MPSGECENCIHRESPAVLQIAVRIGGNVRCDDYVVQSQQRAGNRAWCGACLLALLRERLGLTLQSEKTKSGGIDRIHWNEDSRSICLCIERSGDRSVCAIPI